MWRATRHIQPRVAALYEQDLIRLLRILKVPPVCWRWLHGPRLALVVLVDDAGRNEVVFRNGRGICHSERVFVDGLNGTPGLQGTSDIRNASMITGMKELFIHL